MIVAGERVDRYIVERLVGQGGMAEVYEARHAQLGTRHALKLLTVHRAGLPERLLLEGRIQAQLRHPNVVMVTDVVEHGGRTGLVMEFVDGQTLEAFLVERGPLPVAEALRLLAPILAGVGAAHAAGVLHRDLKPGNVLLARTGEGVVPKVTDFGIARLVMDVPDGQRLTQDGMAIGTPGYMAPEQFRRGVTVDRRADVFALGALLYEMLGGRPAFAGDSLAEVLTATASGGFTALREVRPEVPQRVSDAVGRALAPEPADRFVDCAAFAEALYDPDSVERAQVRGGTPTPVRIEAAPAARSSPTLALPTASIEALPPEPPARPGARLPLWGWVVFFVVDALVLGLLGWAVLSRSGEPPPAATEPAVTAAPSVPAPAEGAPNPVPDAAPPGSSAPAAAMPAPLPASPPVPAPGGSSAPPVAGAPATSAEPLPPAPAEATPVVAESAPAPAAPVAEPTPVAAAPVAEPVVADAAPVAEPPSVEGTWKGRWTGRPLTLAISRQEGGSLSGSLEVLVGTSVRTFRVTGTVDAGGSFSLRDAEGSGLKLAGTFAAGGMSGMVTLDGKQAMSAFEGKKAN